MPRARTAPQKNAYIERYNRTVRYGWLAQFIFASIAEFRDFATEWIRMYNNSVQDIKHVSEFQAVDWY